MRSAAAVVYLGLGSNLGDRLQHLRAAVQELAARGAEPQRASRVYASPFVGPGVGQPEYLNAVLEARTRLAPLELLAAVREVEALHGRRPGTHMLARPLDVDILFYGGWCIRHPDLVIPHPRLAERRFVLEPLHDLGVLGRVPWPALTSRLDSLRRHQHLEIRSELAADGDRREPGP